MARRRCPPAERGRSSVAARRRAPRSATSFGSRPKSRSTASRCLGASSEGEGRRRAAASRWSVRKQPVAGVTTVLAGPANGRRDRTVSSGTARSASLRGPAATGARDGTAKAQPTAVAGLLAAADASAATEGERRPARGRPEGDRAGRAAAGFGQRSRLRAAEIRVARRTDGSPREPARGRRASRGPTVLLPVGRARRGVTADHERNMQAGQGAAGRSGLRSEGRCDSSRAPTHRDEYMATLPAEQQIIADRLATGGMPADPQGDRRRAGAGYDGGPAASRRRLHPGPGRAAAAGCESRPSGWTGQKPHCPPRRAGSARSARHRRGRRAERRRRTRPRAPAARGARTSRQQAALGLGRAPHASDSTEGKILQALRLSAGRRSRRRAFPAGLIERLVAPGRRGNVGRDAARALAWRCLRRPRCARCGGRSSRLVSRRTPPARCRRKAREAAGRIPALAPMLGMAMPPPPEAGAGRADRPPGRYAATAAPPATAPTSASRQTFTRWRAAGGNRRRWLCRADRRGSPHRPSSPLLLRRLLSLSRPLLLRCPLSLPSQLLQWSPQPQRSPQLQWSLQPPRSPRPSSSCPKLRRARRSPPLQCPHQHQRRHPMPHPRGAPTAGASVPGLSSRRLLRFPLSRSTRSSSAPTRAAPPRSNAAAVSVLSAPHGAASTAPIVQRGDASRSVAPRSRRARGSSSPPGFPAERRRRAGWLRARPPSRRRSPSARRRDRALRLPASTQMQFEAGEATAVTEMPPSGT